ncbi:hypothetical protein XPA_010489 [Xanthoria parietina]
MCLAFFFCQRTTVSMSGNEKMEKSKPVIDWVRKAFKRCGKRTEDRSGKQGSQTEPVGNTGGFHVRSAYLLDSELEKFDPAKEDPSGKCPQPV